MGSVKGRGLLTSSSALGLATVVASLLIGCQKNNSHSEPTGENLVTNENKLVERSIGDALNQFQVLGTKALEKKISDKSVLEATSDLAKKRLNQLAKINVTTKPKPTTGKLDGPLVLGFPVSLLNENQVFGAAITARCTAATLVGRSTLAAAYVWLPAQLVIAVDMRTILLCARGGCRGWGHHRVTSAIRRPGVP